MGDLALLAPALGYPDAATGAAARRAAASFDGETAQALAALADWLDAAAPGEPEEQYTRLFDLSPVCTLHAGYHLFGEAYQRGSLLAGLAEELRHREIPLADELPDYLPTLLVLASRLDDEGRQALAETLLLPALTRMVAALGENPLPWARLLRALPEAVIATLAAPPTVPESLAPPADAFRTELPTEAAAHA